MGKKKNNDDDDVEDENQYTRSKLHQQQQQHYLMGKKKGQFPLPVGRCTCTDNYVQSKRYRSRVGIQYWTLACMCCSHRRRHWLD